MRLINALRRIRGCESEVPAQLVLDHYIKEVREEERMRCETAISKLIVKGALHGDGSDRTAERNGLVQASNAIYDLDS